MRDAAFSLLLEDCTGAGCRENKLFSGAEMELNLQTDAMIWLFSVGSEFEEEGGHWIGPGGFPFTAPFPRSIHIS